MKNEESGLLSDNYNISSSVSPEINHQKYLDPIDTDNPVVALEHICSLNILNEVVYVYCKETGNQLEVHILESNYLVRYLLRNGFYCKECTEQEVKNILSNLKQCGNEPEQFGLTPFE